MLPYTSSKENNDKNIVLTLLKYNRIINNNYRKRFLLNFTALTYGFV